MKIYLDNCCYNRMMRERIDYTKWQRRYDDGMTLDEFHTAAVEYEQTHPFPGKTII